MNGLKIFLFRIIPISTLFIAICVGLATILTFGGNYTYVTTQEVGGINMQIFDWNGYTEGLNPSGLLAEWQELDITQVWANLPQPNNDWDVIGWIKYIVNQLILTLNMIIWIINTAVLGPIKLIGQLFYYVFSLFGFKMNQQIAWNEFPIGAFMKFLAFDLQIPNYIPYI